MIKDGLQINIKNIKFEIKDNEMLMLIIKTN